MRNKRPSQTKKRVQVKGTLEIDAYIIHGSELKSLRDSQSSSYYLFFSGLLASVSIGGAYAFPTFPKENVTLLIFTAVICSISFVLFVVSFIYAFKQKSDADYLLQDIKKRDCERLL